MTFAEVQKLREDVGVKKYVALVVVFVAAAAAAVVVVVLVLVVVVVVAYDLKFKKIEMILFGWF